MQISQIRLALDYSQQDPKCFVTGSVLAHGLVIVIVLGDQSITLTTVKGKERVFKTVDSAMKTVRALGLSNAQVDSYAVARLI